MAHLKKETRIILALFEEKNICWDTSLKIYSFAKFELENFWFLGYVFGFICVCLGNYLGVREK